MASVTLQNIKKSYDETKVIKGVDLDIGDGEFLVLVGPSGCGKSTLLRLIAGLETITSGDLSIGEQRVNDVPPKDRGIGMVFQSYALYPHMTVFDNMAFGLKIRKIDPKIIKARVEEASALLDLSAYLDRFPKQLSGGQRQRVAMGRAIVRQPEVFLFDEPLSNLDAALRTQMRIELKKLHRRLGATMIYVTHDQVEAMTLADRIAILNQGHLQQLGSPEDVFERPNNLFVATFIGSPSMNIIDGSFEGGHFKNKDLSIQLPGEYKGVQKLGIRPQHLRLADEAHPKHMSATVDVVEPMGWEAHVHVHVGEQHVILHAEIEQLAELQPGMTIDLHAEAGKRHLFDDDGKRIDTI